MQWTSLDNFVAMKYTIAMRAVIVSSKLLAETDRWDPAFYLGFQGDADEVQRAKDNLQQAEQRLKRAEKRLADEQTRLANLHNSGKVKVIHDHAKNPRR